VGAAGNGDANGAAIEGSARRRIWLCADDYGISTAVNTAIRDLIVRGRINATSAMVAAPHLPRSEAVSLNVLNSIAPRAAIGLHVTLTAPFRPLSRDFSPVLDGAFLPLEVMLRDALLHRLDQDALRAEVACQLDAFRSIFSRPPDFVDGHHHVQVFPQIGEAVLQSMQELAPQAWLRQCGRVTPLASRLADGKGLLLDLLSWRLRRRAAAAGVSTNPAFAGTYAFDDRADFAALFPRFLDRLPEGGLVMCHPGFVDDELRRLDSLTTLREKEYTFFASDGFPALLAGQEVTLAAV
jgi:chitin disaccharide deacetylase